MYCKFCGSTEHDSNSSDPKTGALYKCDEVTRRKGSDKEQGKGNDWVWITPPPSHEWHSVTGVTPAARAKAKADAEAAAATEQKVTQTALLGEPEKTAKVKKTKTTKSTKKAS